MSLTSGSNNSFTKMRLMMMMKTHSGSFKYGARITITIFMVTIFFLILSFKESKYQDSATNPSQAAIELQQNIIKGIVLTEDGKPLIDATITAEGANNTSLKSSTFPDGRFTMNDIKSGTELTIECLGFKTQKLKADFSSIMTVKMVKDPDFKGKVFTTEIQTVNFRNSDFTPANSLVVVNGDILDKNGVLKVNPTDIKSLKVLMDKEATSKYGDKGKDGVLEIILFGYKTAGTKQAVSKNTDSDSSKYNTHLSINYTSNKGELIDIPVPNLQYASVWTYHDTEKTNKKEFRTIGLMTRDYYKVKGKIVGENGNPLVAVKISISEDPIKATSDKEGHFLIEDVRENALLEFSLPGFNPYYINTSFVPFNMELTIELKKDDTTEKDDAYDSADKMP